MQMSLLSDVRLSFRTLVKNPGFTAVAVATLALGIGVNATVFTVTNAVLFKGFPMVERNDRLVYITPRESNCCVSYRDFLDYRAQAKSFEGMAIVHGISKMLSDDNGFPENLDVTEASAGTFHVVGQRPIMGRDFAPSDEINGAAPVAMLNYTFWERRYGKDPTIIGRTVRLNGTPTTVIGIMPRGFSFPQKLELWVPLVQTPTVLRRENRDTWMAIGRMAPGVTVESAQAEMDTIGKRLAIAYPLSNRDIHPLVQKFHEFFIGPNATLLYGSMWSAVGFVLLIACANLANLMLARAIGRSREISVRIALGAGRWRIVRQLLIESVMLSTMGGVLGWLIAKWGVHAYQLAMIYKSSWLILDYTMDSRVLGYLIAISIGTGLLFGLAPALRLSKLDVNASLKDGGRGATGGGRGKHLSSLLVIGEMALAVVLLAGAGVMIRSFLKIHTAEVGARTENILVALLTMPDGTSAAAQVSFFDRLKTRLEAVPGVESMVMADSLPTWGSRHIPCEFAGAQAVDASARPRLSTLVVSPGYFPALGASLLSGRDFNERDGPSGVPVAIVNQRFAAKFWPGADAIGKRLRLFGGKTPEPWLTVVGVASNIIQDDATRQVFGPVIYLPYRQKPEANMWILARTRVPPQSLMNAFRSEIAWSEFRCAHLRPLYFRRPPGSLLGQSILWISLPDFCGHCAAAGVHRPLCCDCAFGESAHAGNRRSDGARRNRARYSQAGFPGGHAAGGNWPDRWAGRVAGRQSDPEIPTGECFTRRPNHPCHRIRHFGFVRDTGLPDSGAPGDARGPGSRSPS